MTASMQHRSRIRDVPRGERTVHVPLDAVRILSTDPCRPDRPVSDQLDSIGDWCRSVLGADRVWASVDGPHTIPEAPWTAPMHEHPATVLEGADGTEWTVLRIGSASLTLHVVAHRVGPPRSSLLAELAAQRLERTLTWSDALIDAQAAAEIDPLTGLGNRRVADRIIATVPVGGGLIVLDLDDFKETNNRCGHAAGDAFLRYLAPFLVSFTRSDDRVARLGGDEFVIGITDTGDAGRLSRRLVTEWNRRGGGTVSAGSAVRAPDDSPHDVFERADAELYRIKRARRGQDLDA